MAITCFLAKFWSAPVINACGKKNPDIQNTSGVPFSIQLFKKLILSVRSCTQEFNSFRDKNPLSAHIAGTWLSNNEFVSPSNY